MRSVTSVRKNPIMKEPVMLMTNVPVGKGWAVRERPERVM
jgi:hypothetical protein